MIGGPFIIPRMQTTSGLTSGLISHFIVFGSGVKECFFGRLSSELMMLENHWICFNY